MKKALIFCHTKNVLYLPSNHFLGELFLEIENKYFPDEKFIHETVDICADLFPDSSIRSVHHVDDAWSEAFVYKHRGEYDVIFIPDCAGEWYSEVIEKLNFQVLQDIINRSMTLLTEYGILMVSKLVRQEIIEFIKSKYKNATLLHYDKYNMAYFIFTKTRGIQLLDNNANDAELIYDLITQGYMLEQIAEMIDPEKTELLFQIASKTDIQKQIASKTE